MLALLGALREEIMDIRERMSIDKSLREPGCRLYIGSYGSRPLMLVQSGVGKERAETATRLVLDRYPVAAVVSMGIAGGLNSSLKAGDVFVSRELGYGFLPEQAVATAERCLSDAGLADLACRAMRARRIRFVQGRSLSTLDVVIDPRSKQKLGAVHDAGVVDMESYWVARIATERGVPFLSVRTVSDTSCQRIPDFGRFMKANGSFKPRETCLYFSRHPTHLIDMMRMSRNVSRAKRNLWMALESFIGLMPVE